MVKLNRIGICGSHRTGKTTILHALKSLLPGYAIITEVIREYDISTTSSQLLQDIQYDVLHRQIYLEKQHSCFISDRTTLDNAAYFLSLDTSYDLYYVERAIRHAHTYDLILYVPVCAHVPLTDDGYANTDPVYQQDIDYLIVGLLARYDIPFILVHPLSIDDRVSFCVDHILQRV